MVIFGALIGVLAALLAQAFGNVLARSRDQQASVRRLAARMLGLGRVVIMRVGNARKLHLPRTELVEQLEGTLEPFVACAYELKWIAEPRLRALSEAYQNGLNTLLDEWDAHRQGMLDTELVAAANAFDAELERLATPRTMRNGWRLPKP